MGGGTLLSACLVTGWGAAFARGRAVLGLWGTDRLPTLLVALPNQGEGERRSAEGAEANMEGSEFRRVDCSLPSNESTRWDRRPRQAPSHLTGRSRSRSQ